MEIETVKPSINESKVKELFLTQKNCQRLAEVCLPVWYQIFVNFCQILYLVCAVAGQDRLNRSGSGCSCHSALEKSQKYFHRLLFLQLFRPAQQAVSWVNSPRSRGGLSVSCSSYRGTLLLPPWLRWLGESERCDHAAGPEVTPSWELRYSCISPTWWLRPPTPRYNYLTLLTTHHSPHSSRVIGIVSEGLRSARQTDHYKRTSAEEMSEK